MNSLSSIYHTVKFWLIIVFLSIALGTVSLLAWTVDPGGGRSRKIASLWSRLICRLNGVPVDISGLENLNPDQAHIIVANHQSYFDIFALSGYLPIDIVWMAKSVLFKIPFVGWAMRAAGYISVEREDKKKAYRAFMEAIDKIKAGFSVVIFPEGTRSEDGEVAPFKKGSHLLALRSGTAMSPVTIVGSGKIIKKGSGVIRPG
ncbi:MAG: 1-acyl-sn-glycerol-3-phosphate acyltransferase, partial [Nitrospinae bacterium]|nr:1-acyl-sn-glycerol-3-phosphate acyltransferase [Nitrospinota bacterium]